MKGKQLSGENKRPKLTKWIWIILCSVQFILLIVVGIKSNYFNYILYKLDLVEDYKREDHWAKIGWTNTLSKLNLESDAVFFGNSITRGSSFHEEFKDKKIVNLGYSGDDIQGMLTRVEQVRCVKPKKVFLMAGINGINSISEKRFRIKYTALVDSMLTVVSPNHLYVQSILPVNKKYKVDNKLIIKRNEIIKEIALSKNCTYLDIHSSYFKDGELPEQLTKDGIHLHPESYKAWGEIIKPYLYM